MPTPLVIFGTGEIAEVAHFHFSRETDYMITAFTCDDGHITQERFKGLPVVPFSLIEQSHPAGAYQMFIAVGYSKLNDVRREKYHAAKAKQYSLASFVSSKATRWDDLSIGDNCLILEHNNIQPLVKIGSNVTLWSGNHIGHHSVIGDHCFITSHAVISGGVTMGEGCFVGVNATVRDHITLGDRTVVGAGAYIAADTAAGSVYAGLRAKASTVSSDDLKDL